MRESLLFTGHAGPPLLVLIAGTEGLFGRMRNETGPVGIGKTALALKTARSLFPTFEGDGFIVELASLSEASRVPSAVAGVLALNLGGRHLATA
jgi:hypothetical protein